MTKQTVKIDGKPVPVGTAEAFKKLAAAFHKANDATNSHKSRQPSAHSKTST